VFPIGDSDDLGEYEVEDDWNPYQCDVCERWTEHGSFSELDDEFVCDECAVSAARGDCA
jgi:rubredoxin